MSRVSIAMHNTRLFVPVNESESRVVQNFETLGLRVILYVSEPAAASIRPVRSF